MDAVLRAELAERGVTPECVETIDLVRDILARVGDKWTVLVVTALADGPKRYTTLLNQIAGISQRMLGHTLRALTRDGLVARTAYAEMPPRVMYELTPLGTSLADTVNHVVGWVQTHQQDVLRNRESFDHDTRPRPPENHPAGAKGMPQGTDRMPSPPAVKGRRTTGPHSTTLSRR